MQKPQERITEMNKTNKKIVTRKRKDGRLPLTTDEKQVVKEQLYRWLKFGDNN